MSSPIWAAAPLHPAGLVLGAGSEHGGVERRAASSCLGRGLPTASMPRGGSSRLTSRRNRLNCRTWASSLPWSSLVLTAQQPLEWSAQSHSTGRISAEAPRQGASSQVRGAAGLRQGGPSAGLCGTGVDGPRGLQGAGEAAKPGQGPCPGSRLLHVHEQPGGGAQPRLLAWNPQGLGSWGLTSPLAHAFGRGSCTLGLLAGPGGLERRETGNRSLALLSCQQPDQGQPLPGSPGPGPQQPLRKTDVDVPSHSHTHGNHTRTATTHARPTSHSDLVLKTQACVNSVKRDLHSRNQAGLSLFLEAGPLGVPFHPHPHPSFRS